MRLSINCDVIADNCPNLMIEAQISVYTQGRGIEGDVHKLNDHKPSLIGFLPLSLSTNFPLASGWSVEKHTPFAFCNFDTKLMFR